MKSPINLNFKRMLYVLLALVLLLAFNLSNNLFAYQNDLAVGDGAKHSDYIDIHLNPVEEIDYKSQSEILNRRTNLVNGYPELLKKKYYPNKKVFGQILSGKPWWGIIGSSVYGSGKNAILGASEETRFLFNPFLLVGALPWSNEIWDKEKVNKDLFESSDFPYFWKPSILRYHPSKKVIQIAYQVTSFNQAIEKYDRFISDKEPIKQFGLCAYNARDFGYNYLFVAIDKSENIINTKEVKAPVKIRQYLHCGGSSGFEGGCNNMSPGQAEIDHLELIKIPARATILLWKNNPGSVDRKADLTVLLEFK